MTGPREWDDARDRETAELLGQRLRERERKLRLPAAPPAAVLLRRGHRMRRRRRLAVSAAAIAVLAVPLGVAGLGGGLPGDILSATDAAARRQTVGPGERVEIGHGLLMTLLGEGEVAVGTPKTIDEAAAAAEPNHPEREGIPTYVLPDVTESVGGDTVHVGTWQAPEPPTRLVVDTAHGELTATLVSFGDSATWGAFFVVVPGEQQKLDGLFLYGSGERPLTSSGEAEPADPDS